jgi:hypothetical protein
MRGAREHEHHRKQCENLNNNGEKQEMQVLLDFTLFLVLLLFCLLLALCQTRPDQTRPDQTNQTGQTDQTRPTTDQAQTTTESNADRE